MLALAAPAAPATAPDVTLLKQDSVPGGKLMRCDSITITAIAGSGTRRRTRSSSVRETTQLTDRPARAVAPSTAEQDEAAAHTSMLNALRAQWQVPKTASPWRKLQAALEWRSWWVGHLLGLFTVDRDERAALLCVYAVVLGLLSFEAIRRGMALMA